MKLTIAFLLVAFGISAVLSTPAPVPKKLKNDWAQHKAFFTPEEEAARRKASLAKSEDIFRGQDHSNLKGVFKQNPAKTQNGKNRGVIQSADSAPGALSGRAPVAFRVPVGMTNKPTTMKPTSSKPVVTTKSTTTKATTAEPTVTTKSTTMKPTTASTENQKFENSWLQYKAKYHLKYNSTKDEAFRKDLFAKTDAIIEKHNSDPKATYQMAHNQFSIMTEAEKKSSLGYINLPDLASSGAAATTVRVPIGMTNKPNTMKPTTPVNQKLDNAWLQYKAKYQLKYNTANKKAFRKDLFAQTDAMIQKHNSDPKATYQMAHNQFSTMTEEEKNLSMGLIRPRGLAASGAAATAVRVPIGMTNKPTTLKPITAAHVNQRLENAWLEHKAKYNLKYNSTKEEAFRMDLFAKADADIEKHNSDPEAFYTQGHSKFSHLTEEERKGSRRGKLPLSSLSAEASWGPDVRKPWNMKFDEELETAWAQHKVKYHLSYDSPSEEARRKARFVTTDTMIKQHNSKPNVGYKLSHNKFSTMTDEEKVGHMGLLVSTSAVSRAPGFPFSSISTRRESSSAISKGHRTNSYQTDRVPLRTSNWNFMSSIISPYPVYDKQLENAWAEHKDMFNLSFYSVEEEAFRKAVFTKNDKIISKHNSDPNTIYLRAHNKYSTLTNEEKQAIMRTMKSLSSGATNFMPETSSKPKDGYNIGSIGPSSIKPANGYYTGFNVPSIHKSTGQSGAPHFFPGTSSKPKDGYNIGSMGPSSIKPANGYNTGFNVPSIHKSTGQSGAPHFFPGTSSKPKDQYNIGSMGPSSIKPANGYYTGFNVPSNKKSTGLSGGPTILPGTPSKTKDGYYTGFVVPSSIKPANAAYGASSNRPSRLPQVRSNPIIHHQGPNNAHGGGTKKTTKKGLMPQHG